MTERPRATLFKKRQQGQAIIELSFALTAAALVLSGFLLIAYVALAKIWLSYQLEQTLLCSQSLTQPRLGCLYELQMKVHQTLAFGKLRSRIDQNGSHAQLKSVFTFLKGQELIWNQSLDIESATKKDFSRSPCSVGSPCSSRSSRGWR